MPDQKPPRLASNERATVLALIQYQRESFVRKVSGIDDNAARRSFVGTGTSLLWLTKHLAQAEALWLVRRFAGSSDPIPDDHIDDNDTIAAAIDTYRTTWKRVDKIIAAAPSLDVECRDTGVESPVNLRWVLMHLLEETARHAGHADILREMLDGATGR